MAESVFVRHANPCVSGVRAYVPGPTASMISTQYGIALDSVVKLSSNEAPLGPSPAVRSAPHAIADRDEHHRQPTPAPLVPPPAARSALRALAASDALHRYPTPYPGELIRAMAKSAGVAPSQI